VFPTPFRGIISFHAAFCELPIKKWFPLLPIPNRLFAANIKVALFRVRITVYSQPTDTAARAAMGPKMRAAASLTAPYARCEVADVSL
jgi:hypothetical protein